MDNLLTKESKYVVAVSGGVDSVVLLHMLATNGFKKIIVAHINHGIRPDSNKDQELVKELASNYNYGFETVNFNLGANASEETSRKARYEFLNQIKSSYKASAIITAHHQDDVIETAFINIIRGTGRNGLSSLKSDNNLVRPLLNISKSQIIKYAKLNNLKWLEDSTNQDKTYLRNKIRHDVVAKMSDKQRASMISIIKNISKINLDLDNELKSFLNRGLHKDKLVLNRSWFCKLPHNIATEVARLILIRAGSREIDKDSIERFVVGVKTLPAGKTIQLSGVVILLTKRSARIKKHSKTDN
ncbi:MAG: tRNA lysidine(34) synthetase TilS [Patescibacteria group bacterium]|jgi:tRNA(Ile)-lysidine synthetase-like protein|nr:tRNA lysidine(34) synthetase TilS [Patescibacteria group bacterium]